MTVTFRRRATESPSPVRRSRADVLLARRYRAEDGFEAFIPESVVARMHTFARKAAPKEWAALLVVARYEDAAGTYVVVDGVVPFDGVVATEASVATTAESERRARGLLNNLFPGAEPGGWAHSHPGWGLFFSSTDKITQATWTATTSLGLVVDPTLPDEIYVVRGPRSEIMELVVERAACRDTPAPIAPQRVVVDAAQTEQQKQTQSALLPCLLGCILILLVIAAGLGLRGSTTRITKLEGRVAVVEKAAQAEAQRARELEQRAEDSSPKPLEPEDPLCSAAAANACLP